MDNTNICCSFLESPFGRWMIAADELGVLSVRPVMTGGATPQLHSSNVEAQAHIEGALVWLSCYFSGRVLPDLPSLHLVGTPFQMAVWQRLLTIPYGHTTTYGALAHTFQPQMSPRAVGQAVSRNPIAILVPCHRLIAAHTLGGYAYGQELKHSLLTLEGVKIPFNK